MYKYIKTYKGARRFIEHGHFETFHVNQMINIRLRKSI